MYSFGLLMLVLVMMSVSASGVPVTNPPTTTPVGCSYQGQFYPPGEISSDPNGCYGVVCDSSGYVYTWDNFNCLSTTTPMPTTVPPTTPPGCYYNGEYYPPGEIESGSDGQGWCYGTYCTDDYQLVAWDNFSCLSTTSTPVPPTTIPYYPTTSTPESKWIHKTSIPNESEKIEETYTTYFDYQLFSYFCLGQIVSHVITLFISSGKNHINNHQFWKNSDFWI